MADPNVWKWKKRFTEHPGNFIFACQHVSDSAKIKRLVSALYNLTTWFILDPNDSSTSTFKFINKLHGGTGIFEFSGGQTAIAKTHVHMSDDLQKLTLFFVGKISGKENMGFGKIVYNLNDNTAVGNSTIFKTGAGWNYNSIYHSDLIFTGVALIASVNVPLLPEAQKKFHTCIFSVSVPIEEKITEAVKFCEEWTATTKEEGQIRHQMVLGPIAGTPDGKLMSSFIRRKGVDDSSNGELEFVGQCGSNAQGLPQIWKHGVTSSLFWGEPYVIGHMSATETTNYLVVVNKKRMGSAIFQYFFIKVLFDPATDCNTPGVYKTPFEAYLYEPIKYFHFKSLLIELNPWLGSGSMLYSQPLKAFVLPISARSMTSMEYATALGGVKGMVVTIPLTEIDAGAQKLTVPAAYTKLVLPQTTTLAIFDGLQEFSITLTPSPPIVDDPQTFIAKDDNLKEDCFAKISVVPAYLVEGTKLEWQINTKAGSTPSMQPVSSLFTGLDDPCQANAIFITTNTGATDYGTYASKMIIETVESSQFFKLTGTITETSLHIVVGNKQELKFTSLLKFSIVSHPCNAQAISLVSQASITYSIPIKKKFDGSAVPLLASETPQIDYDFVAKGNIKIAEPNDCYANVTGIMQIQNSGNVVVVAGTYENKIVLVDSTLTLKDYSTVGSTWTGYQVYIKIYNDYHVGLANTKVVTLTKVDHPCNAQGTQMVGLERFELEYETELVDFVSDFTFKTPEVKKYELTKWMISPDPTLCPLQEFKFLLYWNQDDVQSETAPKWLSLDKTTGSFTFSGYESEKTTGKVGYHKILIDGNNYYREYSRNSVDIPLEIQFKTTTCSDPAKHTITANTDKKKEVELQYVVFQTEKEKTFVSNGESPEVAFDPVKDNFFTVTEEARCKITKYQLTAQDSVGQALALTNFAKYGTFSETDAKITFQKFANIDASVFNGAKIFLEAKSNTAKSALPGEYLKLKISTLNCSESDILSLSEKGKLDLTYESTITTAGVKTLPEASVVETMTLDMSKGFFDTNKTANCSLKEFTLTKVLTTDDKELENSKWANIIAFDSATKVLTIKGYGGADVADFHEAKLMWQAKIDPTKEDLSVAYHLVTIELKETLNELADEVVEEVVEIAEVSVFINPIVVAEEDVVEEAKVEIQVEIQVEPEEEEKEPEKVVEAKVEEKKKEAAPVKILSKLNFDFGAAFFKKSEPKKVKKQPKFEGKEEEEVEWVRPPSPPELRKITLGTKGELVTTFSEDINWPPELIAKFEEDKKLKAEGVNTLSERRRRLKGGGGSGISFLEFDIEGATNNKREGLSGANVVIEGLKGRELQMKILFDNPSLISMGDQSIQDRLAIKFNLLFEGTNGMTMTTKGLGLNEDGQGESQMNIQPMVDEESDQQKALDEASGGVSNIGMLMTLLQFILTSVASTSLEFFWTLINSQVNYVYLPLMSVNPPGQVSFYMDVLIYICTFDPIPMDIVYEFVPVWDFDKVNEGNNNDFFARIGIEDRNIINVLGSLALFIFLFMASQSLYGFLSNFKGKSPKARKYMKLLATETAYRTVIIVMFLETYADLLLGGFVSAENDEFFSDISNWGWRGNLKMSDQVAIIIGKIFFVGCLIFPFYVVFILQRKFETRYENGHKMNGFDRFYEVLYDGMRTNISGYLHYYSVFLFRKMIFCFLVYYMHQQAFCSIQVMINAQMSFLFVVYLIAFKPMTSKMDLFLNVLNEYCFYVVSLLYLCFTDINPYAENKIFVGWLVVFICICNLIWPNGYVMISGIWPDLKGLCFKQKNENLKAVKGAKKLNEFRSRFIQKYDLQIKAEFQEEEEDDMMRPYPKKNQITPMSYFPELEGEGMKFFSKRQEIRYRQRMLQHLPMLEEPEPFDPFEGDLSIISELEKSYEEGESIYENPEVSQHNFHFNPA